MLSTRSTPAERSPRFWTNKRMLYCLLGYICNVLIPAVMFQKEFVDQSHAGIIAEALFRVFDEDKSGELSFYEFLQEWNQPSIHIPC